MKIKDVFGDLPTLTTERLILRKLTLDDAYDLFDYASNPENCKYLPWRPHHTIEDSIQFLEFVIKSYKEGSLAPWGIVSKADNKMIGTIDIVKWLPNHHKAEIGFVLSYKYWGKGLAVEAANKIIEFGFDKMELNRIEAFAMIENVQSLRVLQKLGMQFEGVMREHWYIKGKFRDMAIYSILKRDYFKPVVLDKIRRA
ncbi:MULTISPECIES: GNAT family N-acetyltransferase [Geobacillus]|nr:GNAT family protein [Geobacillus thermoleovorans]AKM19492.1 Putative ribosomal N-acetyltransferase YdaF [Geobacillus sp. 12AMOR1]MBW7643481.1 GNAT family N-acetyltransferase [Geobacillus thermoleovorans]MED4878949.1 GNAT family protein [Anoxybacillus geothermalis]MED4925754.1 GNAT family protein [Anoxybacillus geothermalis]